MKILNLIINALRWRRTRSRIFRTASVLRQDMGHASVAWASEKSLDAWRRSERQQAFFYEEVAREAHKQIWRLKILGAIGQSHASTARGTLESK